MSEQKKILHNFKGIIDSTLREGYQFLKANFSLKEKKTILSYLIKIGVDYIEVGNPVKREIQEMIIELMRYSKKGSTKVLSHIRNHKHDLEKALESQVNGVSILCTVDPERLSSMKMTLPRYIKRLEQNILLAKENHLEVRVGVEDVFNQPLDRIFKIYDLAQKLRVERIGMADTLGKAMNWEVFRRISDIRCCFTVDIEVHFHNDLGHAVSNALTALQAGANWVSTTLLGIGERTGITPLSSLLVNLYLLKPELAIRYNLGLLTKAENYVSRICGIEMPINLMTNPFNGFSHKAGIHLDALIRFGPHKYELLSPEVIGNKRNLVVGSLISGKSKKSAFL